MLYDISDVCRLFRLSPNGVRHYERLGLLHPVRTSGGRRKYCDADLHMLIRVKVLQSFGLELSAIERYFGHQSSATLPDIQQMLDEKIAETQQRIAELQASLTELTSFRRSIRQQSCPLTEITPRTMAPAYFLPMNPLFGRIGVEQQAVAAWIGILPYMRIVQAYHIREGKIVYAADGYLVHQKRAEAQGLPLLERALLLAPRHMKKRRYITPRTMTCASALF